MGEEKENLGETIGDVTKTDSLNPSDNVVTNPEKTPDIVQQTPLNQEEVLKVFAGLSTEKGRLEKEVEETRKAKEAYLLRAKELDEKILGGVKDDPSKLSLVELQVKARADMEALRVEQEKLRAEMKNWEQERTELASYKLEKAISSIASKHNVPVETLKKTGINDIETLERIAIYLKPVQQVKVDSGKSIGGDTDKEFLKRWNKGIEPATPANMTRARNIIMKG